jgi:putative acetyltransferase
VTEIKLIRQYQVQQAKQIIMTACLEIWQGALTEEEFKQFDSLCDIDDIQSHYFGNRGMLLVLVDREKVVGTGAIRQLDNEICELKRMWFLKEYREQGFGREMPKMLFDFARQTEYRKVRLDLANEERQSQALKFYKKLGFYLIERYNDSSCTVFMEKML